MIANVPASIVYGIFSLSRKCLYVGVTDRPTVRRIFHLGIARRKKWGQPVYFKILRVMSPWWKAGAAESRIIHAYWKRGEAQFNKKAGSGLL